MEYVSALKLLRTAVGRKDGKSATSSLQYVNVLLADQLTSSTAELAISNLFTSPDQENPVTLITFIQDVFIDSHFDKAVCEAFKIFNTLLRSSHKIKLDLHIDDIVNVSLRILKSACLARVKEACLMTLIAIAGGSWSDTTSRILDVLVIHFEKKNEKPTVMAKEYELAGLLCHNHPEQVDNHSDDIGKSILQAIEECIEGKAKVSFPLLEGCFKGISEYLYNFSESYELIYKGIKLFSDSKDQKKRGHARAAIDIISYHGEHFKDWLTEDRKYWHPLLLRWMNHSNRDDRKTGCRALISYYKHVGNSLLFSECDENTSTSLQYFMTHFKTVLSDKRADAEISFNLNSYEINVTLRGFATFISNCKALFKSDEFKGIAETITQRALLLYKRNGDVVSESANEETTGKIEELCNHIEALAVMDVNLDKNMEMLIFTLITDFPKCLPHRHYIVINALNKALSVINIKIVVSYFINESCKHFVSSSLYWDGESLHRDNLFTTYETFMPLWKAIIQVNQNSNGSNAKCVYDEFLTTVLKTLPNLDLSTKIIPMSQQNEEVEENEFSSLESFETPEYPHDYKFFTNVCDLTCAILSFQWTREWFIRWIEPTLLLILEGRQKFYSAIGYLKLLEISLKLIKELDSEKMISLIEGKKLSNVGQIVIDLLKDLTITNGDRIFQLRSALIFLQTPPQLLNDELIKSATDAFKIVLSLGKTDLNLAVATLNVLEEWDVHLSRSMFRLLCREVLPILNEYLCSSGVSEMSYLEKKNSHKTKYLNAKKSFQCETSPQLTTFQHRIMVFLGKIDSSTIKALNSLNRKEQVFQQEAKNLQHFTGKFKLSLPCSNQQDLCIYLDSLIPHVKELALRSSNRDTRITACQTIHSIILIMYGTGRTLSKSQRASFSNVQSDLYTALLYLAADPDEAISSMFIPLLKQTCHWLSIVNDGSSIEMNNFICVLFEGSSHPTDNLIRDMSCEAIKEFIAWCIKKCSRQMLEDLPQSISHILRTICQMMLHPDVHKKYGAYLVFIRAISQLYVINSAIDKYLPELLYSVVKSIESMRDSSSLTLKCTSSQSDLAMKALNVILMCLERKISIFAKPSPIRRRPPKFKDATIPHISSWLLSQLKSTSRPLANCCFGTFVKICNSPQKFIAKLIEDDGLERTVEDYFKCDYYLHSNTDLERMELNSFIKFIHSLRTTLDICITIVQNNLLPSDVSFTETFSAHDMFLQINNFLKLTTENNIQDLYDILSNPNVDNEHSSTRIQKYLFENLIIETIWKFFDLVFLLATDDAFDIQPLMTTVNDSMPSAIVLWLFDPHKLTIFQRNLNQHHWSIKEFASNLKNKTYDTWCKVESLLVYNLDKLFVQFEDDPSTGLKVNHDCLNLASEIVEFVDCGKFASLSSKLRAFDVSLLFNLLFEKDTGNITMIAESSEHSTSLIRSLDRILSFILKLNCVNQKTLIAQLTNDTVLFNVESATYGEFCFAKFRDQILAYIVDNAESFFNVYQEELTSNNTHSFMKLIEAILQITCEKNIRNDTFFNHLTLCIVNTWPLLVQKNVSFESLIYIFSLLAMALPNPIKVIGCSENVLNGWLFDMLKDENVNLKQQTKLVVLLPTVLESGCADSWYSEVAKCAFGELRDKFPQTCYEFREHSKERATYLSAMKALLESMANSGSFIVLEFIINCTAADREHICDEQIAHKLKSFMERLSGEEQFAVLQEVYNITSSCSDANLLFNTVHRFMIPLLLNSLPNTLEKFYATKILNILNFIDKSVSSNSSLYVVEHIYVGWISACKMLEVMFVKVPMEKLSSPESQIVQKLNIKTQGQLVKDLFMKVFQIQKSKIQDVKTDVNKEKLKEFLRLAHTAAYKCLYAITIARPNEELKFFTFLINSKGANWEGMIDCSKKYQFPIKTDQVENSTSKNSSVPTKQINNNFDLVSSTLRIQNSMNTLMTANTSSIVSKTCFLKQTLNESMLSYDFNHAIIGDTPEFLNANNKPETDIHMISLNLTNDDLNNHECMATVCQLVKDLDRISSGSVSGEQSTSAGNSSSEWLKLINEVISEKTRDHNVRLFLVQVIDNVKDIFKKYASVMFDSILSVIQDRCTSFTKGINYLDICLLSLLLSWSDTVLPIQPSQKSMASWILHFIIDEINPSIMEADVFRHCLELLNAILSKWGPHLAIQSDVLIKKFETDQTESKKASLQIAAAILVNNIALWDGPATFEQFKRAMLDCLKVDDRITYKSCAEVVGLSLKILADSHPGVFAIEKMDVNEDSEESHFAVVYINRIRKMLLNWYSPKYEKFEKFVECLYNIQKHFAGISNEPLVSKMIMLTSTLPAKHKNMCLKVLFDSMHVLDTTILYKELKAFNFDELLSNQETRTLTLHILNKAFDHLKVQEVVSLVKDIKFICDLTVHNDVQCRDTIYEILIKIYNELKCEEMEDSNSENCATSRKRTLSVDEKCSPSSYVRMNYAGFVSSTDRRSIKVALLRGLDDDDVQLKTRVDSHWTDRFSSDQHMHERWMNILREFLADQIGSDSRFLNRLSKIVLSSCKRNVSFAMTKLFDHPLEECIYTDYNWNDKKQNQNRTIAPSFAETLNTQLLASSILQQMTRESSMSEKTIKNFNTIVNNNPKSFYNDKNTFLQNTLQSLNISLWDKNTKRENQNKPDTTEGFTMAMDSSLLFTLEPQLIHRRTYKPIPTEDEKCQKPIMDDLERRLRKKFIADKNQKAIKYSGIAAYKKIQNKKKLTEEKPVEAFKRFRDGDYPDIQINLADILNPLLELASRDEVVAKDFFIVLHNSIKNHFGEFLNVSQNDSAAASMTKSTQTLKNFDLIAMCSALVALQHGIDVSLPSPLAGALLQMCRSCLKHCYNIEEFDYIVRNSAKVCGVEWLGTLILEEKKMIDVEGKDQHFAKKAKVEETIDDQLLLSDEVCRLKNTNQWSKLHKLLDETIESINSGDDSYVMHIEEYFKCFAQLSDWESFITTVSNQYNRPQESSDASEYFNYDSLWTNPWTKNFILPMMFDANIHKLSLTNTIRHFPRLQRDQKREIITYLENFDTYINNWSGDPEKAKYLNTKLSPKMAGWKAMFKFNANTLELVKQSLQWLKRTWMQECHSKKNETMVFKVVDEIQMMGEIYRFVEMSTECFNTFRISEDQFCDSFQRVLSTWKHVLPMVDDDLVFWNRRLTHRSILTSHVQKLLKSKISHFENVEHENLTKIVDELSAVQKLAELRLIHVAVKQSNYLLAEKYLSQMKKYTCLDDTDEIALGIQFIKCLKIKAENESDLVKKRDLIMESWQRGEIIRNNRRFEDEHPKSTISLLNNAASIAFEVNQLNENETPSNTHVEWIIKIISDKGSASSLDSAQLKSTLYKYSITCFEKSVQIAEKCVLQSESSESPNSSEIKSLCSVYILMAKYCRKMKQRSNNEMRSQESSELARNTVTSILRAIKHGDLEARKMFPVVLLELEESLDDKTIGETFKREVSDIPKWLFVPWVSQLLSHLPVLKDLLSDLVLGLAEEYPQSIVHQYRVSRRTWTKTKSLDSDSIIKQLDRILLKDDVETLVKSLSGVCDPHTILRIHLNNVAKSLHSDKSHWDTAFEDLFDDVFPKQSNIKIRGSKFHSIAGNKQCLEEAWKACADKSKIPEIFEKITNLVKICDQTTQKPRTNKNLISIADFSPYLSSYGDSDVSMLDVFGQYGSFDETYTSIKNHIKIAKFDGDVLMLASYRRPIRISVVGSDGRKYTFLIKRGEDLRQDERIQQLFDLLNNSLGSLHMKINTYKVIPLSWNLGLIQWVNNCITLSEAIFKKPENREKLSKIRQERDANVKNTMGMIYEQYGSLAVELKTSNEIYNQTLENLSKYYLRDTLLELAVSPENFIFMRSNYESTLAPMNIAHWILGIGDRHMSNCLLSMNTGSVIGIDFDSAFGVSTQVLAVPELIPFRLTPQLVGVSAPHGVKGNLRRFMIQSLDAFKQNSELLLAAMEVFVREPAIDWLQHVDDSTTEWSPRDKINQCRRKLFGAIPQVITLEDLKMRTVGREFVSYYCSAVRASLLLFHDLIDRSDTTITTSQQVDCLISQATNTGILSIAYNGWEPWL